MKNLKFPFLPLDPLSVDAATSEVNRPALPDDQDLSTEPMEPIESHEENNITKLNYANAVIKNNVMVNASPCSCSNKIEQRTLQYPTTTAKSFGSLTETLLPYGPIEDMYFDPHTHQFTVIFECGCQATKANNNLPAIDGPSLPPSNFISEYKPKEDYKHHLKHPRQSDANTKNPNPYPRFFRITTKGNPSLLDVMALLRHEIGKLPPDSLTRVRSGFTLRVQTDSQSLRTSMLDLSHLDILENISPHPDLNLSKAICHSKELYNTRIQTIKALSNIPIRDVHHIKNGGTTTILTFPTSHPPPFINILDINFYLEPYKEKPKQCQKCYSYMHTTTDCNKDQRCSKCSKLKDQHTNTNNVCDATPYCYLCKGQHPPTSKQCPIYTFEEELLNEARRRGCGRGYVRAERRVKAQNNNTNLSSPQLTNANRENTHQQPINNKTPTQQYSVTKQTSIPSRRGRRKSIRGQQNSAVSMPVPTPTPYFEIPEVMTQRNKDASLNLPTNKENDNINEMPTIPSSQSPSQATQEEIFSEDENNLYNITDLFKQSDPTSSLPEPLQAQASWPFTEQTTEEHTEDTLKSNSVETSTLRPFHISPESKSQEPPNKRGKLGCMKSSNIDQKDNPTPPTSNRVPKRPLRCSECHINYKTKECYKEHRLYSHPKKNDVPSIEKVPNRPSYRLAKDHRCGDSPHEKCRTLYEIQRENMPTVTKTKNYADSKGVLYSSVSEFRKGFKKSNGSLGETRIEKIYGPIISPNQKKEQRTNNSTSLIDTSILIISDNNNPDQTDPQNNPNQTTTQRHQTNPSISSPLLDPTLPGNKPLKGTYVQRTISALEMKAPLNVDHPRLEQTWPRKPDSTSIILHKLSPRDPRLQQNTPVSQPYNKDTNQERKNNQFEPGTKRSNSLSSLDNHSIQTVISKR